jgi:hypothetical protein
MIFHLLIIIIIILCPVIFKNNPCIARGTSSLLTKVKKKKKKSSPNFHLQGSNVLIKLMVENKRASHETQKNKKTYEIQNERIICRIKEPASRPEVGFSMGRNQGIINYVVRG